MTLQQAFEVGLQHHQAGRLAEAEALYRHILAVNPRHADTLHLLGVIAHQVGRNEIAIDLIRQAIALKPAYAEAFSNLGTALRDKGQLGEAVGAYRQAVALKPGNPVAHCNLGNALRETGQLDQAIAACSQAIALKPDYADALSNLANTLLDKGQRDEAIAIYRQAIALKPAFPQTHSNLGNALRDMGQLDEAIAACRQAIALKPDYPEAHCNLGNAFRDKGRTDEAITSYHQAIALRPENPEALSNLGVALRDQGQLDAAVAACRQAIALKPDCTEARSNLGNAFRDKGELDDAIAAYRQAMALKPDTREIHGNLLLTLNYHSGFDAPAVAEEHRRWNRQHAEPLQSLIQPHANDRNPDRRLRIGYVSPDFRDHVVARFLLPLLAHHDRQAFEVFAYAQAPVADAMTQRLGSHTDAWRSLLGLSDAQAAELIRQDGIDILVDLAGHTANNRLLVFAHKPAPVQVTWLGYPNTTGLEAMDYRLTDALADPPGLTDLHYSEKLIRLSPCAWCFQPEPSPTVTVRKEGPITFGSFNNFAKVNATTLDLWARILRAVPDTRLLLKSTGLGSADVRQTVRQVLEGLGIAPGRLELRGHEPDYRGHLALYERIDIALDTFPYHGTTTTCEALWMGVPVVSLAGETHVSRVGLSLLSNVGLPELVAQTPDEYLQIAVDLAHDLLRLAELRATLRQRMEASPFMDAPGFARNVEVAFREMWRQWCLQEERPLTRTFQT